MSVDVSAVALFRQRAAAQTEGRSIAALNSVWKRRGAALRNLLPQRLAASSLSPIHSTSVSVNSREQRSLRSCQPDPCPQPGSPSLYQDIVARARENRRNLEVQKCWQLSRFQRGIAGMRSSTTLTVEKKRIVHFFFFFFLLFRLFVGLPFIS